MGDLSLVVRWRTGTDEVTVRTTGSAIDRVIDHATEIPSHTADDVEVFVVNGGSCLRVAHEAALHRRVCAAMAQLH